MIALVFFIVTAAGPLPKANASSSPNPLLVASSLVLMGYQGQGFYATFEINSTSQAQVRLQNPIITLDYGTFAFGPCCIFGASGTVLASVASISYLWVPIPSSEPVGNHTFTETSTVQYLNNDTGSWITTADSPQTVHGTLVVLPAPSTTVLNNTILPIVLPIAAIPLLAGTLVGIRARRRTKSLAPNDPIHSIAPTIGKTRLPLTLLTICISISIIVIDVVLPYSRFYPSTWAQANILVFLSLIASVTLLHRRANPPPSTNRTIALFSIGATIVSTLRVQTIQLPQACTGGVVGAGFPLPWAPFRYPGVSYGPLPLLLLPCPYIVPDTILSLTIIAALLDTLFYFAIGLSIVILLKLAQRLRSRERPTISGSEAELGH